MKIKAFSSGLLDSNEYLVWNESSGIGAVIDCGNYVDEIHAFARENGITVTQIILTHGHYDHADFTSDHLEAFPQATLVGHQNELALLSEPMANLSAYFGEGEAYPEPHVLLKSDDAVIISGDNVENDIVFRVIDAPGHTEGSFLLYCEKERIMFTGDVIFKTGRGRTDLPYGDEAVMQQTLARIRDMDKDIAFYSGHGAPALLGSWRA